MKHFKRRTNQEQKEEQLENLLEHYKKENRKDPYCCFTILNIKIAQKLCLVNMFAIIGFIQKNTTNHEKEIKMNFADIVNEKIDAAVDTADAQVTADAAVRFIKDLVEVANDFGDIDAAYLNKIVLTDFVKTIS